MIIMSACLALLSHHHWAHNLPLFLSWAFIIQATTLLAFFYLRKHALYLSPKVLLTIAIVVHCIGIMGQPIFEDDYFRYLWDAYLFYTQGTPYGIAPESFFTDATVPDKFHTILGYINHPSLPTIYGPTLQYGFLLAFLIDPGNVWVLQCLFAIANLVIIGILLKFAHPHYIFLYIFSPLVFKEILLTAHPDGFAVAFLMAALWARQKDYPVIAGGLLGLSIAAKVFAVLFIPFLLLHKRVKVAFGLGLALTVAYLPFLQDGASDLAGLFHMANDWEFNSALWGLSNAFFPTTTTRLFMAAILMTALAVYGFIFYRQQKINPLILPRGDIILGCFLLCAPVINPWYLVWILPFAVIWPSVTAWFSSFIVLLSYLVPLYFPTLTLAGNYDQPVIIRWIEFSLLGIVFISECYWHYRKRKPFTQHLLRHSIHRI